MGKTWDIKIDNNVKRRRFLEDKGLGILIHQIILSDINKL